MPTQLIKQNHVGAHIQSLRRAAEHSFQHLPNEQLKQGISIVAKPVVYPTEFAVTASDAADMTNATPLNGPHVYSFDAIYANADTQKIKLLEKTLGTIIAHTESKEIAFQSAYYSQGLLVIISAGEQLHAPIILPQQPKEITRVVVVAQPGSEAVIIDENRNGIVEVQVEAQANMTYVSIINPRTDAVTTLTAKRAHVNQDGRMKWIDIRLGGKNFSRAHEKSLTSTHLIGTGAQADTFDLFFGTYDQQFQIASDVVHAAPHTTSQMTVKGILNDRAKALYRGLIKILPHATTSNGYQKEDTLLLSDTSEIDPVPSLEILNNEVKCGHGSTTTYVDKEKLFYLMSRGIDEQIAAKQVVQGFAETVVREIPSQELQEKIRTAISDQLEITLD